MEPFSNFDFPNSMKLKLNDIANLTSGLFCRPEATGAITYLQAKHFNELGKVEDTLFPDLPNVKRLYKHLLKEDDILFAAKGHKNFATVFSESYGQCVASSTFIVIRISDKHTVQISADYLVWFLNLSVNLKTLQPFNKGTSLPSISISDLGQLEIPIPTIQVQQLVLKIAEARSKQNLLKRAIEARKEMIINHQLYKAIQ